MLRVAITGGIGSGKSTLTAALAAHGAIVIDADQLARDVLAPGTSGFDEVVRHFGVHVVRDGHLDRGAVAAIVFADPHALATLEAITHPRVRHLFEERVASLPAHCIVVHEVPLLAEKALEDQYHLTIAVAADDQIRRERLVARGMDINDVERRMANQMSEDERARHCDLIVDNSEDRDHLTAQGEQIWQRLAIFAENLHAARPAQRGASLVLAESTPEWADLADRLMRRLRVHLGDLAVRHVGSTAVPGLIAKPVIDLQVSVPDLDAVDGDALLAAGFASHPNIDRDDPRGINPDPTQWRKRFYLSCDPGQPVNIHVRQIGSPGERYAVLFRDWLRANEPARNEYTALKQRLSAACESTAEYAEAKEPWFAAKYEQMEAWARSSGWSLPQR